MEAGVAEAAVFLPGHLLARHTACSLVGGGEGSPGLWEGRMAQCLKMVGYWGWDEMGIIRAVLQEKNESLYLVSAPSGMLAPSTASSQLHTAV